MRRIDLRNFRRTYDVDLILASTAAHHVGELVWDSLVTVPQFDRQGMPNTIFRAFEDGDIITDQERDRAIQEAKDLPLVDAKFGAIAIEMESASAAELAYPSIGSIGAEFELKKVKQFSFSDVKARVMPDGMRADIDDNLEILKRDRWDKYDGRIRWVHMVTELFYGGVTVKIDSKHKAELEAAIANTDLEISGKNSGRSSVRYSFKSSNVPFAMRIERVRRFNG